MNGDNDGRNRAGREAAERYVESDAYPGEREREDALIEWLERAPEHEAAYERCEAAIALARELAVRDGRQSAGQAAAAPSTGRRSGVQTAAAKSTGRRAAAWAAAKGNGRRVAASIVYLYQRPALAWSVAGIAVLVAVLEGAGGVGSDTAARDAPVVAGWEGDTGREVDLGRELDSGLRADTGVDPGAARLAAARVAAAIDDPSGGAPTDSLGDEALASAASLDDLSVSASVRDLIESGTFASVDRATVLPGDVIVDVHSLAVLPFDGSGDERQDATAAQRIAMDLYDQVLGQLAQIPGIYVADRTSSAAYDGVDLVPGEVAAYLGVRGVVEGALTFEDGRIYARLRVTDAAAAGRSFERAFNRPVAELQGMRSDIVSSIVTAMAFVPLGYSMDY